MTTVVATSHRTGTAGRRRGTSLVELLVVLAIIAVLLSLLLPALGRARSAGRAVACQATLRGWAAALQAYLTEHRGHSLASPAIPPALDQAPNPPLWWEVLRGRGGEAAGPSLLCPEATEPANVQPRSAFQAWGPQPLWDGPGRVRATYVGSYGFNGWLYQPDPADGPPPGGTLRLPARDAGRVPVVFDCAADYLLPAAGDPPGPYAGVGQSLSSAALARHGRGTNLSFLDGHVEHRSPAGVWDLRWSETFVPRAVSFGP